MRSSPVYPLGVWRRIMSNHQASSGQANGERQQPGARQDHGDHHHQHDRRAGAPAGTVKDRVCGMSVDPHTAKYTAVHAGRTHFFCSARCRDKFIASPTQYLSPEQARAEAVPDGTIYTCPMHPEIRQAGPGSCPICGMALEPVEVGGETGPNPELVDMTR